MVKKWTTESSEEVLQSSVFKYHTFNRSSNMDSKKGVFDVLECFNWVNIIPITDDGKIVMVEQYRHGTDELTLEIPGGVCHKDETFLDTAKRELKEETGYEAKEWIELGVADVNPAFMTNSCGTYLAKGAYLAGSQDLDPLEEIDIQLIDHETVYNLIKSKKITHSLVIAAFGYFEFWKKDL